MTVIERFLKYVTFDTQSDESTGVTPSTAKQMVFAQYLKTELEALGLEEISLDENGYLFATLPANVDRKIPTIGFIAHMDTSPDMSGENVSPRIVSSYDGSDITLCASDGIVLSPRQFPELKDHIGEDLIVTDGHTLLGADDKAGIAEIMTMAAYFLGHPEVKHGTICIGFTPDEEVGRGADGFDVDDFGADVAYTVDGGALGELEYENFNAASGRVTVHGANIHPGTAKGRMRNALLMAMEFQSLLPANENPMYTEGYEGFYHLDRMTGCVEEARMDYIIRDHDRAKFERRKELFSQAEIWFRNRGGSGEGFLL